MLKHLANQASLCQVIPNVLCVVMHRYSLVCMSTIMFLGVLIDSNFS